MLKSFAYNKVEYRKKDLGIITGGVAYQYAREVFPQASILKLGMVYPLPVEMIRSFCENVEKVVVLEELDPFIEDQVRLMGFDIYRPNDVEKSDTYHTKSIFPITGELNPEIVRYSAQKAGLVRIHSEKRWREY